ncbi:MAG: hypothetical protein LBD13_02140 [Spirochaetaceae bacterium]|nr:hypothetical protein [Spirochaetaceae bacterium]
MSGRGGNNRRGYRRKGSEHTWQETPRHNRKSEGNLRYDKRGGGVCERIQWVPPVMPAEPLPTPVCPYCGKAIKDIASAIEDKTTNEPAHFDCVISKVAKGEALEKGDSIVYIGGGRFGVVHFNNSQAAPSFKIKKILEWEDKENRAEWRKTISDHYSVT